MDNETILTKAIGKAVKNGFSYTDYIKEDKYGSIVFNHKFAKAFFGEGRFEAYDELLWHGAGTWESGSAIFDGEAWQYHLMAMVISKDPIKYLEQFLDK